MCTHSYPLITDHLAREIPPFVSYGVKNVPRVCTLVPFIGIVIDGLTGIVKYKCTLLHLHDINEALNWNNNAFCLKVESYERKE